MLNAMFVALMLPSRKSDPALYISYSQALAARTCTCPNLQYVETDMLQLQLKQRHEPRHVQEALEGEYAAAARMRPQKGDTRRPIGFEGLPDAAPAANGLLDFGDGKARKRCAAVPCFERI